jgi:peroxiredoxin
MRTERLSTLLLTLSLAACGTAPPAMEDVPMVEADTSPTGCVAPTPPAEAPIGSSVGRSFRDFTLPQCDGTPYTFYNDEFCAPEHTFTVVSIAAIWCVPCQQESAQLTARITNAYRDRGVRVVQIIVDGETRNSSFTPAQCDEWVRTYGLVNPELMDMGGATTNIYFPDGSLPSTLIVDDQGVIRFRENGATMGLVSLSSALDSLLAEP